METKLKVLWMDEKVKNNMKGHAKYGFEGSNEK